MRARSIAGLGLVLAVASPMTGSAEETACKAFRAGAKTRAQGCAEETLEALVSEDTYSSRVRDLNGVGERAVPTLIGALKSGRGLTRRAAADALGRIGVRAQSPEPIIDALVEAADDAELKVRQQVIGSLGRIRHSTPAKERVLTKAEDDDDLLIRMMATAWRESRQARGEQ